jgi:glycosyltransferase involved in cell wall biosynthesis
MRIAQVAPLYESVPPQAYGGTERVIHYLTEELIRQGHEVTLSASGDSCTSAELIPICSRALWRDGAVWDTLTHHVRQLEQVALNADRFDVIHFHGDPFHFPLLRRLNCPYVTTLHGRLLPADHGPFFDQFLDAPLVSISNDQRRPVPWADWQGTVYHGLPVNELQLEESPDNYLLFLGRIMPEKRPDLAMQISECSGVPLKMAARLFPGERDYFNKVVQPLLTAHASHVDYLGEVGGAQRDHLLAHARALVFPIDWAEPFGMVLIEAMACGTPVIAFRRGSVPEVVEEGVSGFIVDSVEEAVAAVRRIDEIDRRRCRQAFEERFTASRMAQDYLAVYERLLASERCVVLQ